MNAPVWADPPPIGGPQDPRAKYVEMLRPLMLEPGRWAVIKSGTPSSMNQTATKLRERIWNMPPGQWEFTVRTFRRGHHVGDMNVAQLYARFIGPDGDMFSRTWHGMSYRVRAGTVFDEWGYRICPDCGDRLVQSPRGGSWPKKCDACWVMVETHGTSQQRKWARNRKERRANGHPVRNMTPMCVATECRADAIDKLRGLNVCAQHAAEWADA